MTSKNDATILKLRKEIENRRAALGSKRRFSPVTHCSLRYDGGVTNIRTLSRDELVLLASRLSAVRVGAEALLLDEPEADGFSLSDWIEDAMARIEIIDWNARERELAQLEQQLERLLSQEKQTELQIEEIARMLKE